jgi:hypothetical protein
MSKRSKLTIYQLLDHIIWEPQKSQETYEIRQRLTKQGVRRIDEYLKLAESAAQRSAVPESPVPKSPVPKSPVRSSLQDIVPQYNRDKSFYEQKMECVILMLHSGWNFTDPRKLMTESAEGVRAFLESLDRHDTSYGDLSDGQRRKLHTIIDAYIATYDLAFKYPVKP